MAPRLQIVIGAKDEASSTINGVAASLGKLGGMATTLGLAMGGALLTGVVGVTGAVGVMGFQFNAGMQQAKIGFETMLGSAEKADAFLKDLADFAAKTPFEFPELVASSQKLLAFGFTAEQIRPMLTAIGDAVSGLGGGSAEIDRVTMALGQMQAKGKVSAEEMMQLAELGIPAWQILAERIGVSIPEAMKLAERGAISADVAVAALTEGMSARFGGMMDKQSRSFNGLMSTLKDIVNQAAGQITAPIFDATTAGLQKLVDFLSSGAMQSAIKTISEAVETFANFMERMFTRDIVPTVQTAVQVIRRVIDGDFDGAIRQLQNLITQNSPRVMAALQDMGTRFMAWIEDQVAPMVERFRNWAGAFLDWIGPMIPPFLRELGKVAGAFFNWFMDNQPKIAAELDKIGRAFIDWIAPRIPPMLVELSKLLGELTVWMATTALPRIVTESARWSAAMIKFAWDAKEKIMYELANAFVTALMRWYDDMTKAIAVKMLDWTRAMWSWVDGAADRLLDELEGLKNRAFDWLGDVAWEWQQRVRDAFKISLPPIPGVPNFSTAGGSGGGGGASGFQSAPAMAEGGIVSRPTLALIGERGPEAVVPLGRGGVGATYNVTFTGPVYGVRDLEQTVMKALVSLERSGRIAAGTTA